MKTQNRRHSGSTIAGWLIASMLAFCASTGQVAAAETTLRSGRAPQPELGMEVATSLLYLEAAIDAGDFDGGVALLEHMEAASEEVLDCLERMAQAGEQSPDVLCLEH
mgnify:CR=1 FL=1